MKTLNKPEIVFTLLLVLAGYMLFTFSGTHIFSLASTYISDKYARSFKAYKYMFLIAGVALAAFVVVKAYQKKIATLQNQYLNFFEDNPMPMAIIEEYSLKFLAANKATINTYGYNISGYGIK